MALRGEQGWEAALQQEFGPDRWATLRSAMQRDVEHVCFVSPFLALDARESLEAAYALRPTSIPGAFAFDVPEDAGAQYRVVENDEDGVIFVEADEQVAAQGPVVSLGAAPELAQPPFFFCEGAAVIVARALQATEGETVLDAFAAPGGKSLVLATAMFAAGLAGGREQLGRLVLNEASKPKGARMQRSVRAFLPAALFDDCPPYGPHVVFTAADMGTPVNTMDRYAPYDKILLDAPCTADRELLRGTEAGKMARWSVGTVRVSAERQLKLLRNALWLLKEGGILLFCNQALTGGENDEVIEQLLVQEKDRFELDVLQLEEEVCRMVPKLAAETTAYGVRILPDVALFGPVYFSRIRLVQRLHPDIRHVPDPRKLC